MATRLDGPGWPDVELAEFAEALGDAGLAEVARLTEERRAAADPDSWAALGIKILREQLAAASGEVDAQWHELIGLREKDHPVDVIRPFQDLIELGLERTSDKYRYPKAIKALKRLREDYVRAGDAADFAAYLEDLRQRQRRKTSFIARLDAAFTIGQAVTAVRAAPA